jgi:hypothetical protein
LTCGSALIDDVAGPAYGRLAQTGQIDHFVTDKAGGAIPCLLVVFFDRKKSVLGRKQLNAAFHIRLDLWQREIRAQDLPGDDGHFAIPIGAGEHGGTEPAVIRDFQFPKKLKIHQSGILPEYGLVAGDGIQQPVAVGVLSQELDSVRVLKAQVPVVVFRAGELGEVVEGLLIRDSSPCEGVGAIAAARIDVGSNKDHRNPSTTSI